MLRYGCGNRGSLFTDVVCFLLQDYSFSFCTVTMNEFSVTVTYQQTLGQEAVCIAIDRAALLPTQPTGNIL